MTRHKSLIGALVFFGGAASVCALASRSSAYDRVMATIEADNTGYWRYCGPGDDEGLICSLTIPRDVNGNEIGPPYQNYRAEDCTGSSAYGIQLPFAPWGIF